ncbi:hypothetical protein ACFFGV_04870 [Pontibacillus salicampi]|uniref:DUF3951 domain-containing protein n=1 Tax=Pontibacillus salicampi TaxID=1449801 RepID=A0ABV6LKK5_9BACI
MSLVMPVIGLGSIMLVIVTAKVLQYKKHNQHPPRKWEGRTPEELEEDRQNSENEASSIRRGSVPGGGGGEM